MNRAFIVLMVGIIILISASILSNQLQDSFDQTKQKEIINNSNLSLSLSWSTNSDEIREKIKITEIDDFSYCMFHYDLEVEDIVSKYSSIKIFSLNIETLNLKRIRLTFGKENQKLLQVVLFLKCNFESTMKLVHQLKDEYGVDFDSNLVNQDLLDIKKDLGEEFRFTWRSEKTKSHLWLKYLGLIKYTDIEIGCALAYTSLDFPKVNKPCSQEMLSE